MKQIMFHYKGKRSAKGHQPNETSRVISLRLPRRHLRHAIEVPSDDSRAFISRNPVSPIFPLRSRLPFKPRNALRAPAEDALAALTSAASIAARQAWVRHTLWNLIGGEPAKTPLNARVTGSFARANYRVDKLIYESRPNLFVTANLYVPTKGSGPFPAVLFQSGHYWEGKAYPSYQRFCQGLAQLGFVVLAFEPMGQGERINYPDATGLHSRLPDPDAEHTMPGRQLLLLGDTTTRFQLWDAVRSLDYLLSLSVVDARRVASVGHSGGGTLTMLLAAADERLAAAAVCMGNAENVAASPFLPPGATDDAEQNFVYSAPVGFDRWDLFYPFAPKPMLIVPSDRDFLATYSSQYIHNGWEEYQKLKIVYERLNYPAHLSWADTPLPHALAYDSRLLFYNWFTRWLKPGTPPIADEPPVNPEPVSDLWATESGSVVRSLGTATPFSLNQVALKRSRQTRRNPASIESLLKLSATDERLGQADRTSKMPQHPGRGLRGSVGARDVAARVSARS